MKAEPDLFDLQLPMREALRQRILTDSPEHLPRPPGHTPIVWTRPSWAEAFHRLPSNTAVLCPAHRC